ncbi:MAG: UvrD-helicase domain-containing protein, partial [Candidatus Thorarchaeota archaeon]
MTFNPNDQQRAYIGSSIEGAKRVLAGPGAGKTATLVHRVNH